MAASGLGTKMVRRRGNCDASGSCRSFTLWGGTSAWPSVRRSTPDVSSARSLNLGSHGHEISGCELKLWIQSFVVGAKALARNETNYLILVNHILITLVGTPFISHQWGSLSGMGMPPTWEKGSHLPPGTTSLVN